MQDADEPNTLSELLRCMKSSEAAYRRHSATAEAHDRRGSPASLWWRMQSEATRFHPDSVKWPGVDDLEAICQAEFGSGLTAENLCRIRGRLAVALTPVEADSMTIQEAANRLSGEPTKVNYHDIQTWLLRMRGDGEPYTSQRDLAARLKCSEFTINKAINNSDLLKGWMARHVKRSPKAQSLNEVVTDNIASQREGDPADRAISNEQIDTVMSRLIQEAPSPEERARLNSMDEAKRREIATLVLEQKKEPDSEPPNLDEAKSKPIKLFGRKP